MHYAFLLLAALLSDALAATTHGNIQVKLAHVGPKKRGLLPRAGTPPSGSAPAPKQAPPPQTYYMCGAKDVTFAGCTQDSECRITSTRRSNIGKVGIPVLDAFYTLGDGFCNQDYASCDAGVFDDSPVTDMCKEIVNYYFPNAQVLNGCTGSDPGTIKCDFICTDVDSRCQTGTHTVPCATYTIGPKGQVCSTTTVFHCPTTKLPPSTCPAPGSP